MRQGLFYFSGARKFCLAHGLRQLIRDTKKVVSCLQTSLKPRHEKARMTLGIGGHTMLFVKNNKKKEIIEILS